MRIQSKLKEILSSFLIGFMVSFFVFQPYLYVARADIGNSISGMINESVNYAPPTFKEMGERGYVGFGSLSIRTPVNNLNIRPFSFTPPFIKKGCGAIDIGWGGFNFLGFDYLVQKLQQILQAAPAFAFQLALEVFVPQVSQVLSKINAIADMINNINFDACKATTNLVHAIAPSLHDMIFDSRTDEAGQKQANGEADYWKGLKDVNTAFQTLKDEIESKFADLMSSLTNFTSNRSDNDPIKILASGESLAIFRDRVALNNPEYAPRNTYLRFTSSDDYNLKTAFIGDLIIQKLKDDKGKVADVSVAFNVSEYSNMEEFISEINECVNTYRGDMESAVRTALSFMDASVIDQKLASMSCTVTMPVDDKSIDVSFDVGRYIVRPILKSLVDYYISISQGGTLDADSVKWINFIATMDSGIIRAIRVAALAGGQTGDSSAVAFIGNIVSADFVSVIAARYMSELVGEGCSELMSAITALSVEIGQAVTADSEKDSKSVSSSALLNAIKDKVASEKSYVASVCNSKIAYANRNAHYLESYINKEQRQGLIELAKNLEKTLVENLNSRGLGTLAKYVHVEQ